jgi:RNA polymerase sigma-70 factor (family 1)
MAEASEETLLLRAIAAGDEAAFAQLYHKYSRRIFEVAMMYLQDEATAGEQVQDIFIKVWQQREKLRTVEDVKSWLFILSRNTIYDRFRQQQVEARRKLAWIKEERGKSGLAEEASTRVESRQYEALLRQAIEALPLQRRRIYQYSRTQGMSVDNIAQVMGISRHTVKNQLKAANHFIRDHLKNYLELLLLGAILLHG